MDPSLLQEFVLEASHSLETVEQELLTLAKTSDPNVIQRIFRALHSIKGSSTFLELRSIERVAHQAESLLDPLRLKQREVTPEVVDTLLQCIDDLQKMLRDVDQGESDVSTAESESQSANTQSWNPQAIGQQTPASANGESLATTMMISRQEIAPAALGGLLPSPGVAKNIDARPSISSPANDSTSPPPALGRTFSTTASSEDAIALKSLSKKPARAGGDSGEKEGDKGSEERYMRVKVGFLDELLQLTGNMVMARNQLLTKYDFPDDPSFLTLSQCVTKVHKSIVQTRMQTIGTLFDRCERLVHDLCRQLGKEATLFVHGRDLELDRSVLESFADPLMHLIRNAVDHGLESPADRQAADKPRAGTLKLSARQQGSEIVLILEDDGKGINPQEIKQKAVSRNLISQEEADAMPYRQIVDLIFRSGFSTREEVSTVSGRGVGLDVVRNNLEAMGGVVEVQSTIGKGTVFVARVPLAHALISSSLISALIIAQDDERFAIPQTSIDEIIKVDRSIENSQLKILNGRMVYQLREMLLPVIPLDLVLHEEQVEPRIEDQLGRVLVVMQYRQKMFGLIVDSIVGVEEIVVRPLPELVKGSKVFSAHTVRGDGQVALILDSAGIIESESFHFAETGGALAPALRNFDEPVNVSQRLVVFSYADHEHYAVPLEMISLIEKVNLKQLRRVGGQEYLQIMQRTLPVMRLDQVMGVDPLADLEDAYVLIPARVSFPIAILAGRHVSVVDAVEQYESRLSDGQGMLGTFMDQDRLVMLLDLYRLFERHSPERFRQTPIEQKPAHILVAEDSSFFQNLLRSYLENPPRKLTIASDGQQALEILQSRPHEFDLVISDIEMPRMDGFELVQKIRMDPRLRNLPVLAMTSLASPEHMERGLREGFDSYMIKIDKEQLLTTLDRFLLLRDQKRLQALAKN
ncbi:hybrid sensor histidine kinase/response regulator [Planctomicrobium sp. SH661]|uniref:hybrid sensor histidine kinase/response regulator n=1 Tax=Planctomicrobium sp. SH661 TaxID=3448124 RepID=UPI003F5B2A6E